MTAGRCSPLLLKDATIEQKLAAAKLPDLADRLAKLTADLPPTDAKITQLVDARRSGFGQAKVDTTAGRQVFQKSWPFAISSAAREPKIGPGLDGVGLRGLDRLLEDTLDPSRNVDQAFRTTLINTTGGTVVTGLLFCEEGKSWYWPTRKGRKCGCRATKSKSGR